MGNFLQTIRLATGDFGIINSSLLLEESESRMFWLIWFFTVIVACVIFLNFIVAEASETYNVVSEHLQETLEQ